jgi:molybdopterin molybdotransferase
MISVEEALQRILAQGKLAPAEDVPLADALGRVLAADITSRRTQPPSDVSAMDGYAVRAVDATLGAALTRIGEAPAGGAHDGEVQQGQTVRIFTGGPVPSGADAIVLQEDVEIDDDGKIIIGEAATPGQHVRPAGVDFSQGDVLFHAGRLLSPADLGLLASMDWPMVPVRKKPRIALLATGDELVLPGEPIGPNQIVSSNSFAMAALVAEAGGEPIDLGIAKDDEGTIKSMAEGARSADVLVTIGGASVGERDLVQKSLSDMGLSVDFWKIAMRPGKPLIFGRMDEQLMIGLPGNPVSALVCATLYLVPLIRQMLGLTPVGPETKTAILGCDVGPNKMRQDYIRGKLSVDENGEDVATPFDLQDSSVLSLFAHADILIVRPPQAEAAAKGDTVSVIPLRLRH